MKLRFLLLFFICSFQLVSGQSEYKKKLFNYGVWAGVNAPFTDLHGFTVNGVSKEKPSVNSMVGFSAAIFTRVNMGRHFLQLEGAFAYTHSDIFLDASELGDFIPGMTYPSSSFLVNESTSAIEVPLLYGFNFIKNGPYELSFVAGPMFRYMYSHKNKASTTMNLPVSYQENLADYNINFVLGLGTSISRLMLNVRYVFGLNNISRGINYSIGDNDYSAYMRRSSNMILVSAGLMF